MFHRLSLYAERKYEMSKDEATNLSLETIRRGWSQYSRSSFKHRTRRLRNELKVVMKTVLKERGDERAWQENGENEDQI